MVLAGAAWFGLRLTLQQYFGQRRAELELRQRQLKHDLAELQGNIVALLSSQYSRAQGTAAEPEVREELEEAEDQYAAILRGIIEEDPEMAQAARKHAQELSARREEREG
ncbi:MAG: hypothetical protein HYY02_05990 [Chloroflexi bacterium]|nr:hypothetical protein [Chloroflexota bacterium]